MAYPHNLIPSIGKNNSSFFGCQEMERATEAEVIEMAIQMDLSWREKMASSDAGDGDVLSGDLTSLMWITDLILMNIWWETTNQLYWNLMIFLGVFFHMAFTIQFIDINMAFGMGKRSTNGFGSAPCSFPYWWDDMPPFLPCKLTMAHINGKWNRLHTSGLYMFIHDTVYLGITELELGWLPSRGSGSPFAWQYMARGPRVMWRANRPWFIACLRFTCSNMGYTYSIPTWTVVFIFNLRNPQQWLDGHLFFWDISTMTNMVAIWVKSCLNLVRRTDLASRRTVNHPMFGCQLGLRTHTYSLLLGWWKQQIAKVYFRLVQSPRLEGLVEPMIYNCYSFFGWTPRFLSYITSKREVWIMALSTFHPCHWLLKWGAREDHKASDIAISPPSQEFLGSLQSNKVV